MKQRRKDEELILDEIKENYKSIMEKSIMEKSKVNSRPSMIFSKYREEMNLYNESNESQLEQISQKKEL